MQRNAGDPTQRPDRAAALALYKLRAPIYDQQLLPWDALRQYAIERLALRPGDTVMDAGCGTGSGFEALAASVGPRGRIVGIELCPDMLARARQRVRDHRWCNVTLVGASAAGARLPLVADAALFHLTHDILRDPRAIANIVRHLRSGARVVACGLKWSRNWLCGVNLGVYAAAVQSVTTLEGLDRPWSLLEGSIGGMEVETFCLDSLYVASAVVAEDSDKDLSAEGRISTAR